MTSAGASRALSMFWQYLKHDIDDDTDDDDYDDDDDGDDDDDDDDDCFLKHFHIVLRRKALLRKIFPKSSRARKNRSC